MALAESSNHTTNGHFPTNGTPIASTSNGSAAKSNGSLSPSSNGFLRSSPRRAPPEGTLLEGTDIDRKEFVRLTMQALNDAGYGHATAALAFESGYELETPDVAEFRGAVLRGSWDDVGRLLGSMDLSEADQRRSRYAIARQRYLEHLERGDSKRALAVLRHELAPLTPESETDGLHTLSSFMMCLSPEELRERARWDGAAGRSRQALLVDLQQSISPSVMLPQRRLFTLLEQAKEFQRRQCLYHISDVPISLYSDYTRDPSVFPSVNIATLRGHIDEVWHLQFSHDGKFLATASKDKTVIIWRMREPDFPIEQTLRGHDEDVGYVSWSPDDAILLSAAEGTLRIWNPYTGVCRYTNEIAHEETISSLVWFPEGNTFISTGMDQRIIVWDRNGNIVRKWPNAPIRINDAALTPDGQSLVTVGVDGPQPTVAPDGTLMYSEEKRRIVIFDIATRKIRWQTELRNDISSSRVSRDSRSALINYSPDEVQLWDIVNNRLVRKFMGHQQGHHMIRSCFGGPSDTFILSGSEDSVVYVWHAQSGELIEALVAHEGGSVNAVAWNPTHPAMFASVGDDHTARLWGVRAATAQ